MKTTTTIDEIVAEYLSELSIQRNSQKAYRNILVNFWLWCSATEVDKRNVKVSDLVQYRYYVVSKYSGKYSTMIITVLKSFWKWIEQKQYWHNVAQNLRLPKQSDQFLKEPLNDHEIFKLISIFSRNTEKNRRDYLIVMFMLAAGLRCVEVSRINVCDIITKRGQLCLLIQRKGRTDKTDFINVDEFSGDIYEHLSQLDSSEADQPVFVSMSPYLTGNRLSAKGVGQIVTSYLFKAEVKRPEITPHSLRHTAAVTLIQNNFTIDEIQMFLGHTKSEITKIYTRYANNEIKLQNKPGKFLKKYIESLVEAE